MLCPYDLTQKRFINNEYSMNVIWHNDVIFYIDKCKMIWNCLPDFFYDPSNFIKNHFLIDHISK